MIDTFLREAKRIVFLAAVSFAGSMALAVKATSPVGTYKAARAAVAGVEQKVATMTAAICKAQLAIAACPLDADRVRCRADVSAGAAVVRI